MVTKAPSLRKESEFIEDRKRTNATINKEEVK
jgi:hypothetical protein